MQAIAAALPCVRYSHHQRAMVMCEAVAFEICGLSGQLPALLEAGTVSVPPLDWGAPAAFPQCLCLRYAGVLPLLFTGPGLESGSLAACLAWLAPVPARTTAKYICPVPIARAYVSVLSASGWVYPCVDMGPCHVSKASAWCFDCSSLLVTRGHFCPCAFPAEKLLRAFPCST